MNTIGLRAEPGRDSILKFYLSRSYLVFLKIFLLFVKGGKIFAYEFNWIKNRHEFSGESRRGFKFQNLFFHISVSFFILSIFCFLLKKRKIFAHECNTTSNFDRYYKLGALFVYYSGQLSLVK